MFIKFEDIINNRIITAMRSLKTWLIVLVSFISLNMNAQNALNFPVSGQFSVQNPIETRPYNQVTIAENTFTILKDGIVVKQFRIVGETEQGLKIEQFYSDNDDPKRDRERFTIKIDSFNVNEYFVTIYLPLVTDNLHLVKIQ